ncbi:hypothetical protein Ahy_A07g035216 [Arachis hypogaea]|uniref:Uncharacterized protein n=1 Tax=Arachis hypogaea TaxID=3818 RepID=A0A445CDJ5_ARAHY|nr:hypothetical protein Ahy_A07g035216 [Arachis hypogaea]
MIVYYHLSKNKDKKGEERPAQPWIANWNREQLVERMRAEIDGHMVSEQNTLEELEEFLRESKKKKTNEKSAAQGIPDVNLGSENDPLSQGHTDQSSINKPVESMLSLVEEPTNDPAEENMIVVRSSDSSLRTSVPDNPCATNRTNSCKVSK